MSGQERSEPEALTDLQPSYFASNLSDKSSAAALSSAMSWVGTNLSHFAEVRRNSELSRADPWDAPDGGDNTNELASAKALVELASTMACYVSVTGDRDSEVVRGAGSLIKARLQQRRLLDWLMRSPPMLVPVLHLYIAQRVLQGEQPDLHALIQRAIDQGFVEYAERPPHRLMEVRMCLDWGGFRHSLDPWDNLLAESILGNVRRSMPTYVREQGIYELTHVIMFLTRYGMDQSLALHLVNHMSVRQILSDLLVATCQDGHWDLLGELLLCWDGLRLDSAPVYDKLWHSMLNAQNEDGSFPPPAAVIRRRMAQGMREETRTPETIFALSYHTTLVGIMALCCREARVRSLSHGEQVS